MYPSGKMDKRDIVVIVHRAPIITKELGTTKGVELQQVAMECKAAGNPDPSYEFYRLNEGGGMSRLSSTDTRFVDEAAGVVHYNPLTRDDQGQYLCRGNFNINIKFITKMLTMINVNVLRTNFHHVTVSNKLLAIKTKFRVYCKLS